MNEILDILSKPYIRPKEIAIVLGVSESTARRELADRQVTKYERIGYNTDEVIQKFNLKNYLNRMKKAGSQGTSTH